MFLLKYIFINYLINYNKSKIVYKTHKTLITYKTSFMPF